MLDPPSRDFLPDTVRVFGPAESDEYEEFACRVSRLGPVAGKDGPVPFGEETREFAFAEDPGVTETDQVIHWTKQAGVAFADPIAFRVTGPDAEPGGGNRTWRIIASSKT